MPVTYKINTLAAQEVLPLRQRVLWPNHPAKQSKVDGDETALHFGGFLGEKLICVASLFLHNDQIRLRKFATDPSYQGQGFGTQMLDFLLKEAHAAGAKVFWFDARETALPFYERNGYTPEGERFFKSGVAYRRVSRTLD